MKKISFLVITAVCLSAFAASTDFPIHAKPWENALQNLKVVNLFNLSEQELNELMDGKHPEVAVEFTANTVLPISFFLKGDLIQLTEEKFGQIQVKQTFYVRHVENEFVLSTNLSEWKPFLEFITGNISVGLSVDKGPSFTFGSETNRRA